MTEKVTQKMYDVAKSLGELNAQEKVKRFASEKGYAKVFQMEPGCSVWVHHLKDDRLILDLQITQAAESRYPDVAERSIQNFKKTFDNEIDFETWEHVLDDRNAKRYLVDISNEPINAILGKIKLIKKKFSNS